MEEIKKIAAEFGIKYAEEGGLMEKNPILGLAVACVSADGFEFGFNYDGTKEELTKTIAETALNYVKQKDDDVMRKEPLLGIALAISYRVGALKGIEEREKVQLERDEQGNIIGVSTNKTDEQ